MKNVIALLTILFLTSFTVKETKKKLPNGHYLVVLDKEFKDAGMNDYEFTLKDADFNYKLFNETSEFVILWVEENKFKVFGLTEPLFPTKAEKKILENVKTYFIITKQEKNTYYFTMGFENDKYFIYTGKFVKTD
jgi:hypothetical protein